MRRVLITGSIACGKSTFCRILEDLGHHTLSADKEATKAIDPCSPVYDSLNSILGTSKLNASVLAKRVFSKPDIKKQVEEIIHPFVRKNLQIEENKLKKQGVSTIYYEIPIPFEILLQNLFQFVILISCSPQLQIQRLIEYRDMTKKEALNRISHLPSSYFKNTPCDFSITNNLSIDAFQKKVKIVIQKIESFQ